jgi:hypothetical protein
MYVNYFYIVNTIQFCGYWHWTEPLKTAIWVFPKVNWSWMDSRSSKGVWITGPRIKFTGHSHTPERRSSDSYWSFGPVINNLLLDQANFYWTLPHVRRTLGMTAIWHSLLIPSDLYLFVIYFKCYHQLLTLRGHCGHDRMVVGFTPITT